MEFPFFSSSNNFDQCFKTSKKFGLAFGADLLVFILFVEGIRLGFDPFSGFVKISSIDGLRTFFYILGLSQIVLIRFIANAPLKKEGVTDLRSALSRLQISALLIYVLCETVALLGFFLFLFEGLRADFYVFLGLAIFYLVVFFPKEKEWKEWLDSLQLER